MREQLACLDCPAAWGMPVPDYSVELHELVRINGMCPECGSLRVVTLEVAIEAKEGRL